MVLHFSNRFFGGLIFGEGQGTRALINEGGGGGGGGGEGGGGGGGGVLLVCRIKRCI